MLGPSLGLECGSGNTDKSIYTCFHEHLITIKEVVFSFMSTFGASAFININIYQTMQAGKPMYSTNKKFTFSKDELFDFEPI